MYHIQNDTSSDDVQSQWPMMQYASCCWVHILSSWTGAEPLTYVSSAYLLAGSTHAGSPSQLWCLPA